jgi:hypothetical protein
MDFETLKPALVLKRMPRNGKNKSEDLNDFIEQTLHDVAGLYNFVNQVVIPTFNGLGQSGTFSDVDPITDGLDGTTIMVDHTYSDTTSPYFYDSGKSRPKTVFEAFIQVVSDIDKAFTGINEVKARLGTADEDSTTPTSMATLSEIETKVNFLNGLVQQIRNANAGYLNAGQIASGLADGSINPTTFNLINADVLADAGILATKISGVDLTESYTYNASPLPATYDMRDTVLRLKTWFEEFTGETFTEFSGTNITLGASPNSNVVEHLAAVGTGAVTSANPHGLDIGDLTDAGSLLSAPQLVADFSVYPSGVTPLNTGGYAYIPYGFTITKVSLTLGAPGTTGMGVVIWKNTAGSESVLHSGLVIGTSPTPGAVEANISSLVAAGDMLFVSGMYGDGRNARVQVFGRP